MNLPRKHVGNLILYNLISSTLCTSDGVLKYFLSFRCSLLSHCFKGYNNFVKDILFYSSPTSDKRNLWECVENI